MPSSHIATAAHDTSVYLGRLLDGGLGQPTRRQCKLYLGDDGE